MVLHRPVELARLYGQVTLGSTADFRPMDSSANSDQSPCSSKTKLFYMEFSDLHVSKEDSIKPRYDQLKRQLLEAEYLADEDSVFVPANVAAIVHPSQKETFRVRELRQLARQSDRAGVVETRRDLVVQALVRALVVEHGRSYIKCQCVADTPLLRVLSMKSD
jgi:hypothetical protein